MTRDRAPWHPIPPTAVEGGGFEFRNAVQYVGSYKIAEAAALKVTAEDGVVFLHVPGQQRVGMETVEKDVFLIELANARITFERDDAGNIVALVLDQTGNQTRATRR